MKAEHIKLTNDLKTDIECIKVEKNKIVDEQSDINKNKNIQIEFLNEKNKKLIENVKKINNDKNEFKTLKDEYIKI